MLCGYISPLLAACALPLLAPVPGSGRDYCRSPLPVTGGRRGNPPGPPAREQGGRRATSRIASARSAPSLLPRSRPAPQGASHICFSLARPLLLPCSLRALCPSSPPCRVAVATFAAPRYPSQGLVGTIPPARPAREQGGRRATSRIASARSASSLLPRSRPAPQGGLPISSLFSIWLIFH